MRRNALETDWARLSEFIAEAMGLHFPQERWPDLRRGLAEAAREFGFADPAACADWLLSAPLTKAQTQVLAHHLTIGETYFFREKKTLEAVTDRILPPLIESRRRGERRLRLWSAACCTGEEAYSLAIMLHELLPDLPDWHVTILATDINAQFLRKAATAAYGEWSFRDVPRELKERYFTPNAEGRYVLAAHIRKMVTFAPLNLVEDEYPSLATDTNAMDLIFCRNVLMYFAPAQAARAIRNLNRALVEGGWLAVGPSEASRALFPDFTPRNFPGAILYQKERASAPGRPPSRPQPSDVKARAGATTVSPGAVPMSPARSAAPVPRAKSGARQPAPYEQALSFYGRGQYAEAAEALLPSVARKTPDPRECCLLARALANQGRLPEALQWCDRGIAADKLDPASHYLRATVLLEQGDAAPARISLQRAVYLDPGFVVAHFALGNLARTHGKPGEAERHFHNAQQLLARLQPDDPLAEADGLTAGRLAGIIEALTTLKATP